MADNRCVACGDGFRKFNKGYNRIKTTNQVNGHSIEGLLEQYSVPKQTSSETAFVCKPCFNQLQTITKHEAKFLEGVKKKVGPAFMGCRNLALSLYTTKTTYNQSVQALREKRKVWKRKDRATGYGYLKMGGSHMDHKKSKNASGNCVTCGKEFKSKQKSYRRIGVCHVIGDHTVADILFEKFSLQVAKTSFVCNSCYLTLVNFLKYKKKVRQKIGIQAEESIQSGVETGENVQPLVQESKELERYHFLQDVSFYEALLYLEDVLLKYWETPDTVIQLLEILSKLRLGVYGPKAALALVKELFDSSEDMLLGFNVFLPPRHHYKPDPEKTTEKSVDPEHNSGSFELEEGTENDDQLDNEIRDNEKDNKSNEKKESEQYTPLNKKKKMKIGSKGKNSKEKNNAEIKLHDVAVKIENIDDMTEGNEQASQDIVNEKQSCAENVSIESWTLLDDYGSEITISENKFDNSGIESDIENFEQENQKSLDPDGHCSSVKSNISGVSTQCSTVSQHFSASQNVGLQSCSTSLVKSKGTVNYILTNDLSRLPSTTSVKPKGNTYVITKDNIQSTSRMPKVPKPTLQSSSIALVKPKVTVIDVLTRYNTSPVLDSSSPNVCLQSSYTLPNVGVICGSTSQNVVWQSRDMAARLKNKDHLEEEVNDIREMKGTRCTLNMVKSKGKDLGLSLAKEPGGLGFHVQRIHGFPALLHKELSPGDQITKINGVILKNMDLQCVERYILNLEGWVSLQVCHFENEKNEGRPRSDFTPTPPVLERMPSLATTTMLATMPTSAPMPVLTPMPGLAPTPASTPMQVLGIESLPAGSHVLLPSNSPKLVPVSNLSTISLSASTPSMCTTLSAIQGSSTSLTQSLSRSKMSIGQGSSAPKTQSTSASSKSIMPHQFMTPLPKQLKSSPTTDDPGLQHDKVKLKLVLPKGLQMSSLVSKLKETQGSSQVSSTVKTSIQLSDISKKQLLESLSKSIVNNEAILTDTVGIKRKIGKLKEIEHKADRHENSQFKAVSSSPVCKEPTELSDSSFPIPSLPSSTSQRSIATMTVSSSNSAGTAELTLESKSSVTSVSTLLTSKHMDAQGISQVPLVKSSLQPSDVSKKQLLESISKSISKNEAILREKLDVKLRRVGKITEVNPGAVQNSTQAVMTNKSLKYEQFITKDVQVSDLTQSRSAMEETLAIIKPKPSSSTTYIKADVTKDGIVTYTKTDVEQKPKSDTSQSSKNEQQLVDTKKQINPTVLPENTRKTLMKAAMDLINETKQSNPELQNFKLSFVKTADLDNQSMWDDTDASAVESMDTETSSTVEVQDENPRKSRTRKMKQGDYNYFKDVRKKKERLAMLKNEEKRRLENIHKSMDMSWSKGRVKSAPTNTGSENEVKDRVKVATPNVGPENEVKEADSETVMETSVALSDEFEETDTAESDNDKSHNSNVRPDLVKSDNIIELDHSYTGATGWIHMASNHRDSGMMKPKLEKIDAGSAETSGVVESLNLDNENPVSPTPDFLQAIQMAKLEIPETDNSEVVDSGKSVDKTDRAENVQLETSKSNLKSGHRRRPVSQAIRSSTRLSNRARRRKQRLIEEDEVVPKKRQKGVKPIVRPVAEPAPVIPSNCCVHCFRAFLLNKTTKISLTQYVKTDDGKREVLLGTFLKFEVGAEYVNPRWCLCQSCYNLCEKIQKWREHYLGSKETLESAESEFQKRKNTKALLYTKGGKTHRPAVLSERDDDQHEEEVAKGSGIALSARKINSQRKVISGSFKAQLMINVRHSRYKHVIQGIAKHGKKGKRDILEVAQSIIRQEIKEHIKRRDSVLQYKSLEDIERFSWTAVMEEFRALPFFSGIIMAMLTRSNKPIIEGKFSTENTKTVEREYVIAFGVLVSVLFYFRNRRYNTFQVINSIQMYDKGCLKQLYKLFWQVGFCLGEKQRIIEYVNRWTNEKLGITRPPKQPNVAAPGTPNNAEEDMEVPYRYDPNENEHETNQDLQQGGQSQLRENGDSEHLTAEENVSNEELRQALGTIGSFEKMTQRDILEDEDMEGGSTAQYIAKETGEYVPVFENFGVETVEDDRTESLVMEVDGNQTDTYQDTDDVENSEVTVKIKSVGDDGTIELDYEGQDGTELHSLDEWMRIFASKSKKCINLQNVE